MDALPTADAGRRGDALVVLGGTGVADKVYVCTKLAAGGYSWMLVASEGGGTPHAILSGTHTDTTPGAVAAGDLIMGDATPKWTRVAKGAVGTFLRVGASVLEWVELTFSMISGAITDTQHGSRGAALHEDSHARSHALTSASDHSGALGAGQHGSLADGDHTGTLSGNARVAIRKNTGADAGSRRRLNLIEGANVTLTVADDAANEEVDVTIAAEGGVSHQQVMSRVSQGV